MSDSIDLLKLQDRAAMLVDAARRVGADAADAVVATSRSTGVEVRNGEVEETESAENDAFTLRVFVGQKSASISANSGGDVTTLAERAVSMARVSPENPMAGLGDQQLLAIDFPDLDLLDETTISFDVMRDQALTCEAAALAVKGVSKSSGASCGQSLGGSVLVTSHGFAGAYSASRFSLSVSAVAGDGESMERDYDFDSQRFYSDLRSAGGIGLLAGERAVKRINPRNVATQTADIVFDPRVARSLLSHFAGAINGSSIVRKSSFLKGDLGRKVFSDQVAIIDEPHLPRGVASRPFDGEGVASGNLNLVTEGVLQQWLLDTATAKELGLTTNGRANRSGTSTVPGSTNLTLLPGASSPGDMIADVKNGFYVTELIGQGVNLISGDYSRGASGFWIENGKLTYAVSEVTIAGNLRNMFASMVPANDLEKRFGTNAPTIFIPEMTIAGK